MLENLLVECCGVACLEGQAVAGVYDCQIHALPAVGFVFYSVDQYVQVCRFNSLWPSADPSTIYFYLFIFKSHKSAIHLLCNCLALESFGKISLGS
jgi:hypothetical protein